MIKAFSSQSKIRIRSFILLKSLDGSTCLSGNILNRNLEKNGHRNDESVSVGGDHFKPCCNFLPSYRIMLLLGHVILHTCYMRRSPPSHWSGLYHTHLFHGVSYISTVLDQQLKLVHHCY